MYNDPDMYFNEGKLNAMLQKEASEDMFSSTYEGDVLSFYDQKDAAIFKSLYTAASLGKLDDFTSMFTDLSNMDEARLREAMPDQTEEDIKSGKTHERIKDMIKRSDDMRKSFDKLNEEISNPFDPGSFKTGSREYKEEAIRQAAFNHAKMLALFSRNSFTRSLERINSIYTDLSSNPIVGKMSASNIDTLLSMQSLISEINLLKTEIDVATRTETVLNDDGTESQVNRVLSEDEQVSLKTKQDKLLLIQKIFNVLTNPSNISERSTFSDLELEQIVDLKERANQKALRDKSVTLIEKMRQDILSTSSERDLLAEWQVTYSGETNPFGEFDINKADKFKEVVIEYLQFIADKEGTFVDYDVLDSTIKKILDSKSLGTRTEILNKAVATILNPINIVALASRIEPRFKKMFYDNKTKVEERLRKYLDVTKKNIWLNELSAIGVYPEMTELEEYLSDKGPIPKTYYTDEGLLDETFTQYSAASNIISAQENITTKEQKEEKTKSQTSNELDEDIDYEDNFVDDNLEDVDVQQKILGDLYIKDKWIDYVKSQTQMNKKYLPFETWVKDGLSKVVRKNALVIDEIHTKTYGALILKNEKVKPFYEWLAEQSNNDKVLDILNLYNVSLYDILDNTTPTSGFNKSTVRRKDKVTVDTKSGLNITERSTIDKSNHGVKKVVYFITDNNNIPINDKVYVSKGEAIIARDARVKDTSKADKTFTFGGRTFTQGTLLTKDGQEYIVKSTPDMVAKNNNLFIKDNSKQSNKNQKKAKNIYLSIEDAKSYEILTANKKQYITPVSRLKIREATQVNPTYDRSITNPDEQIALGVEAQQTLFRNLTPADIDDLMVRVNVGPNSRQIATPIKDKKPFQSGSLPTNPNIKKNAQKFSIEIYNKSGSFGYFQGPETVLLTTGSGKNTKILSPFELTESDIENYFEIPERYDGQKISTSDALNIVKSNYAQSFYIYEVFDDALKNNDGLDMLDKPLSEFPELLLKLSEGSITWNKNNPLIFFNELETMYISDDRSITTDGEKPYYVMDYNRAYLRPTKNGETMKVQGAPITNIDQTSLFFIELENEVQRYESKYKVGNRLGKYVAFVKLPNGKSAFIPLTASVMEPKDFNILMDKMQTTAKKAFETNINKDGSIKKKKFTETINKEIEDQLFLSADPGIYIELFVANDGQLGVKYVNLNLTKRNKKRSAKSFISHEDFIKFKDISELTRKINEFIRPVYEKGFTLNDFKVSVTKNDNDIGILGTLQTKFKPEIKTNFNLQLITNPALISNDQLLRNALTVDIPNSMEKTTIDTTVELTPEEKREIIKSDYKNVDPDQLKDIARRIQNEEDINDFDQELWDAQPEELRVALSIEAINDKSKDISNTEALLDQNYQGISFKADEDIKSFEDRYWKVRTDEIRIATPEITDSQLIDLITAELSDISINPQNPLYAGYQLLRNIRDDAEGKAFKITDKFDGNDIEDINTYSNWFRNNINSDVVKLQIDTFQNNMVNNQMVMGEFLLYQHNLRVAGQVTVGTNNPFKYHEAFHAVFRMFLSEKEIKKYLKLAKTEVLAKLRGEGKLLSDELAKMRNKHALYFEMSRKELEERFIEEYMADQFETFKMDPYASKVNVEIKSLFQRILDIIFGVLGFPTYTLNGLYKNIDSGVYKNAGVQENRFTTTASTSPSIAYKLSLKLGTKKIQDIQEGAVYTKTINNYMPSDHQHTIISGIANLYVMRRINTAATIDKNIILTGAIDDFISNYDSTRSFYKDKGIPWFMDNYRKLQNYHNSLIQQKDEIKDMVNDRLAEIDTAVNLEEVDIEEAQADFGDITTEQYDKLVEEMGGFSKAPKLIRQIFSTVTIADQDMFGNKHIGENKKEPIMVGVNYSKVYDSILKAVSNEGNPIKMLQKLWVWSQGSNVETKAVVDEIFKRTGLYQHAISGDLFDPTQPFPSIDSESGAQEALFMMFTKQFENYIVPYDMQFTDKVSRIVHIFPANNADDAHYTLTQWGESFNKKYNDIRIVGTKENKEALNALKLLYQFVSYKDIPKKMNIVDQSVLIANQLYNSTGMKFDSNYILFSLYTRLSDLGVSLSAEQEILFENNQFAQPIETEDVNRIIISLNTGENLFLDNQSIQQEQDVEVDTTSIEEHYKGGVKGRLRKIAINNSFFDETVGASTFINEEGNKIYTNQRPTFHLVEISKMKGNDYVKNKLEEDPFLEYNFLLKDPKFESMVNKGEVILSRISGIKEGVANLTLDGVLKENKGFNKSNRRGTKYGSLSPQEFTVALINNYVNNYNRTSPNNSKTGSYINDKGENIEFAIAPSLIRVIESSNTGETVALPVHKMIETDKSEEGGITITDEGYKAFEDQLKRDVELIQKELDPETRTEDDIIGGNTNKFGQRTNAGRLYQLSHNGRKLLSELKRRKRNIGIFSDPNLGADVKKAIRTRKQKVVLSIPSAVSTTNLTSQGDKGLVNFGVTEFLYFTMTNKGKIHIDDMSYEEISKLIDDLGTYVVTKKTAKAKMHTFTIGDSEPYYTYGFEVAEFFRGNRSLTKYEFVESLEDSETDIIVNEDKATGQVTMDMVELDSSPAETFEDAINSGMSFSEAWKLIDGRAILEKRLFDESNEFMQLLKDFKAMDKISVEITEGLGAVYDSNKGTIIYDIDQEETGYLMDLYNLKYNDPDYNILQIFLNDYINTMSFNEILLGDQRLSIKDAVDSIKRAKMQNASGKNASSIISAPGLGIDHPTKNINMFLHDDSRLKKEFQTIIKGDEKLEREFRERGDGQMLITTKAHKHFLFGFGNYTPAQSRIMKLIESGNEVQIDREFFGALNVESYKNIGAIMNSQKLVYADGKVYLKMSAFTLTPLLTSVQDLNGNWTIPIDGREGLHNLRIKMEANEAEGNETVTISVPASASKMLKSNMASNDTAFDESPISERNITRLDASFMRMQLESPSNKIEIVDPRQIKNLITAEQDHSTKVIYDGVPMSVGDVIDLYHQAQSNKLAINWFAKRNLIFNFEEIYNDFLNPTTAKGMTINLSAFLKFAIAGLESASAKSDMLSYFGINETNEPNFNLNNQLTRKKFQTLFLSFISKGVLSARQPGISAALVTDDRFNVIKQVRAIDKNGTPTRWQVIREKDWRKIKSDGTVARTYTNPNEEIHSGLEVNEFYIDRLRSDVMEYNENNEPTGVVYTEMVIPPHHKNVLDNKDALDIFKPLPDAISKMYGIRIPSQDKHSAVNLKVVDFLPVYYGSSAIFARELVELSGADFDIDKLYMQIKDFYYNGKDFVEFGSAKTEKGKYDQYLGWILDQAKIKGSTVREAVEIFRETQSEPIPFNLLEWNNMSEEQILILDNSETIVTSVMADILGLPISFEEYEAYKKKYNGREPYEAAINNNLLDYKYILQGNPGMINPRGNRELGIAHEPAVISPLNDVNAKEILGAENAGVWQYIEKNLPDLAELVNEEDIDIDNFRGKMLSFKANKEGSRSIGAVVSPNSVVNIGKEFNVEVRTKEFKGKELIPKLTINNITYDKFQDYIIDPKTGKVDPEGYRTQFVISALITSMTDNAKERLADKLGLNKTAVGMVTTMTAMGVDINTSIALMNQPVIRENFFMAIHKDNDFDPGIKKLLENRKNDLKSFFTDNNSTIDSFKPKVTTEYLLEQGNKIYSYNIDLSYAEENINEELLYDLAHEHALITQFLIIFNQTESLRNVSTLLGLQKTIGEDLFGAEDIQKASEELGLTFTDKEWASKSNLIPFDFRPVFTQPTSDKKSFHATSYQVFRETYDFLFPKLFLEASDDFKILKDAMMDNMINMNQKKDKEELVNNITSYLNTLAYIQSFIKVSENEISGSDRQTTEISLNNALIYNGKNYGKGEDKSLTIEKVYNRLVNNKKSHNYFIDDFLSLSLATNENNWSGIDKVITNNFTQLNDGEISNIQNSYLELYSDKDTHIDALNLMNYLLVKDGFNVNNRGTFLSLIPSELKKGILNSIDSVQTLFNAEKQTEEAFKRVFGMNKSELKENLITNYLKSTSAQYHVNQLSNKVKLHEIFTIEIEPVKIEDGLKTIIPYENKAKIVVEDTSESSALDITAPRKFIYNNKKYYSVEHAYEVNKTGKFNNKLDKEYRDKKNNIGGLSIKGKGKGNLNLLSSLTKRSFIVNLNKTVGRGRYGDILTETNTFNSIHLQADKQDAYIRGIKQAQAEMVWSKIMYGENAGDFIYSTRGKSAERKEEDTKARKNVAVMDVDKGIFTLKLYSGLETFYNDKIKTIKGSFSINQQTNKKLIKSNIRELRELGIYTDRIDVKSKKSVVKKDQMQLPIILRKTMNDGRVVILELIKYQRDGVYQRDTNLNDLLTRGEGMIYGNYAEYAIREEGPLGSKDQNPIGFLFGDRPGKGKIDKFEEDKRYGFDPLAGMEGNLEETALEDIDVEETDLEDIDITEENIPTAFVIQKIQETSDSIQDQLEITPEDLIKDFYNDLSDEQKSMIPETKDVDDLITTYNAYPMDVNEYIENIKKCHLK